VSGIYTVTKTDTDATDGTCMTLQDQFTVTNFMEVPHPLQDDAVVEDNVEFFQSCSVDLAKVNLCGNQTYIVDTEFDPGNLLNIVWQELTNTACLNRDDDCPAVEDGCANNSNWTEIPTAPLTTSLSFGDAGEYRIIVEFQGGCSQIFYFDVNTNDFQPVLDITNMECDNDGSVTVNNVDNDTLRFLIRPQEDPAPTLPGDIGLFTNATGIFNVPFQDDSFIFTVYAIDTAFPNCIFSSEGTVTSSTPIFDVTAINPTCANDTFSNGFGGVAIRVTNGLPTYEYRITGGPNNIDVTSGIGDDTNGNFDFNNLEAGDYNVEVTSNNPAPNCMFSQAITIAPAPDFIAEVVLVTPETCDSGAIVRVNVTSGSGGPYQYAANATGVFGDSNEFEIPIPADPATIYTFSVSDISSSPLACIVETDISGLVPYVPFNIDTVTPNSPECPGDPGSIDVAVSSVAPIAGRNFTYQLWDCGNDPNCNDALLRDISLWIFVQEVGPTNNENITFVNVEARDTYAVSVSHNVLGDPTADPICRQDATIFEIQTSGAVGATVDITRDLSCIAGQEDAQVTITDFDGGSGTYEWSLDVNGPYTAVTLPSTVIDLDINGDYTIFVRDPAAPDCPFQDDITIDALETVDDLTFTENSTDCNAQTVTITVAAAPTGPTYTYTVIPAAISGDATTGVFVLDRGTTYTFTAQRADNQCDFSEDFVAPVLPEIDIISASQSQAVTCNGADDGELIFTVDTTIFPNFTFEITGPAPATTSVASGTSPADPLTATGLAPGEYTITVTDGNGGVANNCSNTATVTITEPVVLDVMAAVTQDLTCVQDAIITATVTGGNGGNQFTLVNSAGVTVAGPQTTNTFTVDTADTYTIDVTDAETCADSSLPVTVDNPDAVTATIENTSDLCFDTTDQASLDIIINTGTAPFTYTVNSGGAISVTGNTFTITGLTPDDYTIVITDTNGCDLTLTQTIAPQITIAASLLNDLDCIAPTDADIQVVTTGGNGGNTFEINENSGGFVPYTGGFPFLTSTAGTYQFRVTDSENCAAESAIITVTPAPNPAVNPPTIVNPRCNGNADGVVTINIDTTVGTGPYEIDFDGQGFSSQTTYGGLPEGTYSYIVRDAKGCTETFNVTLSAPPVIVDSVNETDISCDSSGAITNGSIEFVNISGGVAPYTLTLLDQADLSVVTTATPLNPVTNVAAGATVTFGDLTFGDYILRVIDANGCDFDFLGSISTTPIFTISTNIGIVSCSEGVDVTITVTGGAPPYMIREFTAGGTEPFIALNPGPDIHEFNDLPFDTPFIFEVIDSNGCTDIQTLTPPANPSTLNIGITENPVGCVGAADGSLDYSITGHQGTELTYTVFRSNDLVNPITGLTFSNGNPQTVAVGATEIGNIGDFGPGTYVFRVEETDPLIGDQCNASVEFTIIESPSPFTFNDAPITPGNCSTLSQAIVDVSGGTEPYGFLVVPSGDPNPETYAPSNVVALDQNITLNWDLYVIDANGCELGPFPLVAQVTPDPTIDIVSAVVDPCIFDGSFEFTVTATGQSQLQFGIDDGDTSTSDTPVFVDGTPTGNPNEFEFTYTVTAASVDAYTITIRDANGCTDADAVIIHPELMIDADFTIDPTCITNGTVTATVTGGSNDATNWTVVLIDTDTSLPAGTGPVFTAPNEYTFTNVPAGNFEVTVTDTNVVSTCTASDTFARAALVDPIISTMAGQITCIGDSDGSILVSIQDGTNNFGPYTYELYENNGGIQGALITSQVDDPLFTGLSFDAQPVPFPTAGEYLVIVTSDFGCVDQEAITLVNPTSPQVDVSSTDYGCTGDDVNFPVITLDNFRDGNGGPYRIEYTDPSGNTIGPIDPATIDTDAVALGIQIVAAEEGDYVFTVTDANECNTDPVTITETVDPFPIMTDPTVTITTDITCPVDEVVEVAITGGTGDFLFEVIDGPDGATLPAAQDEVAGTSTSTFTLPRDLGIYTFLITDQGTSCTISVTHEIDEFDFIEVIAAEETSETCFNAADGSINITITGYSGPYDFEILDEMGNPLATPITGSGDTTTDPVPNILPVALTQGTYRVNITETADPSCMELSNVVTVGGPAQPLMVDVMGINIVESCDPGADGSLQASVTGAQPLSVHRTPIKLDYLKD